MQLPYRNKEMKKPGINKVNEMSLAAERVKIE